MKKMICMALILTILLILPACKSTPATITSEPSISPTDFVEQKTDQGVLVTTNYYSITLPNIWKNNYLIHYQKETDGYTLRFIERVSYETQGFDGLIFSLSLTPAVGNKPTPFPHNTPYTYLGGLYVPNHGMFTLSSFFPTDVQFIPSQATIYNELKDSYQKIIDSLKVIYDDSYYYPAGANTFEQRAKLTTHSEKGEAIIRAYLTEKDPDLQLEYLGIALDDFNYLSDYHTYSCSFHIYKPNNEEGIYYGVPFNESEGTVAKVCKMTKYPKMETIWHPQKQERIAYDSLIIGMITTTNEDLGRFLPFDLDGDGIEELLINNNNILTVYGYQDRRVVKLDSYDYQTGTFEFYHTTIDEYEEPIFSEPLPGLFTRWVGGGQNHYGYLTLENGKLKHTPLWDENYASVPGQPPTTNHSQNEKLIKVSKLVHDRVSFFGINHVYRNYLEEQE